MNPEKFILPCDVRIPPQTTIRAGCKLATLLHAFSLSDRPKHFRDWRPIETAPKDGRVILAWSVGANDSEAQLMWWDGEPDDGLEAYWCVNYEGKTSLDPTHWMPLPEPPAKGPQP